MLLSMQAYYPERLAKLYILHMPGFFVSVWRMVSRCLERATLEKVRLIVKSHNGPKTLPQVEKWLSTHGKNATCLLRVIKLSLLPTCILNIIDVDSMFLYSMESVLKLLIRTIFCNP